MQDTEWIEIGKVIGDTGPKGDTGDIGIGTVIKGHYDTYEEFIRVHPSGRLGDAYIVDGSYYYWNETGWANAGSIKGEKGDTGEKGVKGDTGEKGSKGDKGDTGETGQKGEKGPKGDTGNTGATGATGPTGSKGDTGATGTSITIKGSYNSYEKLIAEHPTGNAGDSYLVNGFLHVWNGNAWEKVGNIKGDKGDTGDVGATGDKGDAFTFDDFTPEQLASLKGDTGDTGATGATGVNGFSPTVDVDHVNRQIIITSEDATKIILFDELKGDTGDMGVKGDTGPKGDKGDTGETGKVVMKNLAGNCLLMKY